MPSAKKTAPKTARDWIGLIGTCSDAPAWGSLEKMAGITSSGAVSLIHGLGRKLVRSAGVYLYFFKCRRGTASALELVGVEFLARPERGSRPFSGSLPHRLEWSHSRAIARARLARLGKPAVDAESPEIDRWKLGELGMRLTFLPGDESIKSLNVSLPSETWLGMQR